VTVKVNNVGSNKLQNLKAKIFIRVLLHVFPLLDGQHSLLKDLCVVPAHQFTGKRHIFPHIFAKQIK